MPAKYSADERARLHALARASIRHGLAHDVPVPVARADWPRTLTAPGASFVTLTLGGELRGCIGSIEASRPLVEDVAHNAFAAAFKDWRFAPCHHGEVERLHYGLSVLTPLVELHFESTAVLCRTLRPHVDGLVLQAQQRRAVFLPQVWEQLPEPRDFLQALLRKAGLPDGLEPPLLRAWRYEVEHF